MPRSYRHISNYENEILELKSQGLTLREIGGNRQISQRLEADLKTCENIQVNKL